MKVTISGRMSGFCWAPARNGFLDEGPARAGGAFMTASLVRFDRRMGRAGGSPLSEPLQLFMLHCGRTPYSQVAADATIGYLDQLDSVTCSVLSRCNVSVTRSMVTSPGWQKSGVANPASAADHRVAEAEKRGRSRRTRSTQNRPGPTKCLGRPDVIGFIGFSYKLGA